MSEMVWTREIHQRGGEQWSTLEAQNYSILGTDLWFKSDKGANGSQTHTRIGGFLSVEDAKWAAEQDAAQR